MTQREKVVAAAKGQVGYCEGSNGYTKFGQWYYENIDKSTYFIYADWCAMFVGWCQYTSGITKNQTVFTASAGDTGVSLYKQKGMWHDSSYTPQSGDLIHFTWGHVGVVDCVKSGYVYTIEGNYSDQVATNCYKTTYSGIRGYAVPNYTDEKNGDDEMNFKSGDSSDGVLALNSMLNTAASLGVTGTAVNVSQKFDDKTLKAVKEVQTLYKLEIDGIAGIKTISALRAAIDNGIKAVKACTIQQNGDWNIGVYHLKTLMKLAKIKKLTGNAGCDEKYGFGSGTESCVKTFSKFVV